MAQCQKQATIYAANGTSSNSTHVATVVLVPDNVTALASCQYLTLTALEYQELGHGYIPDRATAEAIAGPLIALLSVGFIYKAIRSVLDMNVDVSDEKH